MTGDQIEVVIDHDGVFPALRPVRVSYFDPATGEPTDHQVGVQASRPHGPTRAPGGGVSPFNGYPAGAGARPHVRRVCSRCGGDFMVPRQGGRPPRTCPACRRELRLERDLRRRERERRARAEALNRRGPGNPGRAGVRVVERDRLTGMVLHEFPTMAAAADSMGLVRTTLVYKLDRGAVLSGWSAFSRGDRPAAWPRPVVADDGRVRVAFADNQAVRDAFGMTGAELLRAVGRGDRVGFHGREVSFSEVDPSPALAGLRRWRP